MKYSITPSKNIKKLKLQYKTIETPLNKKNFIQSQKIDKSNLKSSNNIILKIPESPNASDFMINFKKIKQKNIIKETKKNNDNIKFISNTYLTNLKKNQIQNVNQNNLSISHLSNNSIDYSGIKLILDFSVNHSNEEFDSFINQMKEEKKIKKDSKNKNNIFYGNQINNQPSTIELIINDDESFNNNNQPIIPLSTMNKSESEEPLIDGGKILNYDKRKLSNLEKLLKKSNNKKYKTPFDKIHRKDSLNSNNSESSHEKNLTYNNVPIPMKNTLTKKINNNKRRLSKEKNNILKQRIEREKKVEEEQNIILNQLDNFLIDKKKEDDKIEDENEKAEDSDDEEENEEYYNNSNNQNNKSINLNLKESEIENQNDNIINTTKQINSKFSEENKSKEKKITLPEKKYSEDIEERVKNLYYKYIEIEPLLTLKDAAIASELKNNENFPLEQFNNIIKKLMDRSDLNSSNSRDHIPREIDKELKEVSKVKKNIKEIENYYENEIKRINFKLNQMGQNEEPSKEKIKIIKEKFIQLDNLYSKQEDEYISTIIELMEELKNLNGGVGISNKLIKDIDSLIIDRNNEENKNAENNESEITKRKSVEKALLEELENFKKEEKNYKFKIPAKYQMNNSIRFLKQTVIKGKIIKFYENSVIDLINRHRTIKRIFPDGYEICYYNNKDVKQKFSDGRIYFYYNLNKSFEFRFFNQNFVVYKFISGQFEKHYFDHSKSVKYSDGTYRITSNKGEELIQFSDGTIEFRDKQGNLL